MDEVESTDSDPTLRHIKSVLYAADSPNWNLIEIFDAAAWADWDCFDMSELEWYEAGTWFCQQCQRPLPSTADYWTLRRSNGAPDRRQCRECTRWEANQRNACKPREHTVYFVEGLVSGLIKVGYTSCLSTRLSTLSSSTIGGVRAICHILYPSEKAARSDEKAFHDGFADQLRHGREWFCCEGPVLDFLTQFVADKKTLPMRTKS
ncbi:MAG: GIY-YIG nuclease family protein [Dehalococcoidales bacterium]